MEEEVIIMSDIYIKSCIFDLAKAKIIRYNYRQRLYFADSSSSMGSYFRGENLSDFELDELNSGNESGNNNNAGKH